MFPFLNLTPHYTKEGPTMICLLTNEIILVNPDGTEKIITINGSINDKWNFINEEVKLFRKENNINNDGKTL